MNKETELYDELKLCKDMHRKYILDLERFRSLVNGCQSSRKYWAERLAKVEEEIEKTNGKGN